MKSFTTRDPHDLPDGLISTKVDTADPDAIETVHELCRFGFRLVTVEITFEGLLGRSTESDAWESIRRASDKDCKSVRRLAATCFSVDRFHSDPMIQSEAADSVKAEWVANFFTGGRGTDLYVSESNGVVHGFLLTIQEPGRLTVDLVAVDESVRGRGIAQRLIRHARSGAESSSPGEDVVVRVGTQLANKASIRTYTSLGLTFVSSRYVLHRVWPRR